MDHFAGLDVSVKETSVCIVDDAGKIVREVKVASEPEALLAVLKNPAAASASKSQADMAGQMAAAAASEKMMVPSFERRRPARRPRQWCSGPGPAARLVVLSARGPGIL